MSQEQEVCGENGYRCEECTVCARTKPCECGCGLLGGTCENCRVCKLCSECFQDYLNSDVCDTCYAELE
jgi:hypothetical protein